VGSYDVPLTGRDVVADGTVAFRFAKPAGFTHVAGQNVSLTLLDLSEADAKGRSRTLTLAGAPGESELMIATRISGSAFKRALDVLPIGGMARTAEPNGDFTLQADPARSAVLLAGGIGAASPANSCRNRSLPRGQALRNVGYSVLCFR
jgi:ferredoxin-NADP reductase